ncbi:MAG: hypothetical protein PHV30_07275 [Candidatus Margulisbacteria bacterium]|nr:hypothetical protein [Candidatus Margulisiibacteriota bacterium]
MLPKIINVPLNNNLFSEQELKERNIFLLPGARASVSRDAILDISPDKKLILKGAVVIEPLALIKVSANFTMDKDALISNSQIGQRCRVMDSIVHNTLARKGSQILNAAITIPANNYRDFYYLTLMPGDSYDEANFAPVRGAVIKRTSLIIRYPVTVPTGHSLINTLELNRVKGFPENIGRNIKPYLAMGDTDKKFIINSAFCHPDIANSLYDPEIFGMNFYSEKLPQNSKILFPSDLISIYGVYNKPGFLLADLNKITKPQPGIGDISAINTAQFIKQMNTINYLGEQFDRIIFRNKEVGYTIVHRLNRN